MRLTMRIRRATTMAAGAALMLGLVAGGSAFAQGTSETTSPPATEATTPSTPTPSTPAPATTGGAGATTGPYVFGSPPSAQANRIYSVNVRTGEVSACQFERPEGSLVGVTRCFRRDASAGPGEPGTYDMMSTRYSGETGIFRVNVLTGKMSVCYVRDMPKEGGGVEPAVVCTAPSL